MGMCSRQERIQKDIDVVIQKCKAEKDCLFAGEFVPGRQVGGAELPSPPPRPPRTALPPCPCPSPPCPAAGPLSHPVFLLSFRGHMRAEETGRRPVKGRAGWGGGIPSAAVATRSTGSAGCEPEPEPGAARGFRYAVVADSRPQAEAHPAADGPCPCPQPLPPSPGIRGAAGAVPGALSRRRSRAVGCLLPCVTMEFPAVAIAPGTCCEGLGEMLHFLWLTPTPLPPPPCPERNASP